MGKISFDLFDSFPRDYKSSFAPQEEHFQSLWLARCVVTNLTGSTTEFTVVMAVPAFSSDPFEGT